MTWTNMEKVTAKTTSTELYFSSWIWNIQWIYRLTLTNSKSSGQELASPKDDSPHHIVSDIANSGPHDLWCFIENSLYPTIFYIHNTFGLQVQFLFDVELLNEYFFHNKLSDQIAPRVISDKIAWVLYSPTLVSKSSIHISLYGWQQGNDIKINSTYILPVNLRTAHNKTQWRHRK